MLKYFKFLPIIALLISTPVAADNVLIIDAQYSNVTNNVKGRLEAAGHTVTVTTDTSNIPTSTTTYKQVWDLRYSAALTSGEQTNYQSFITGGGFAYFVTENPGCCMARNNSVAALVTALGGGSTQIGPGWANNVETNMNTKYMTNGITVNYAAVAAIINSQGIPLISDGSGNVSGMSWIGRAGALGSGVTGTIITVADTNWLDQSRFVVGGTTEQQQNVQALDDIIKGVVAGTVAGTISSSGNGAGATNGNSGTPPAKTVVSTAAGTPTVTSSSTNGTSTSSSTSSRGTTTATSNSVLGSTVTTSSNRDVANKNNKNIEITRTTTVVNTTPRTTTITSTTPITTVTTTVTPRTTTTITTPNTVTTYSDGSTETTNGTPVTTATTTNISSSLTSTANEIVVSTIRDSIVQTTSSDQKASVSSAGLKDTIAHSIFNPFIIDAITTKDGAWATPLLGYAKTDSGKFGTNSIGFGTQKTIDNNTLGIAGTFLRSSNYNFLNSKSDYDSYGATVYALNKQNFIWIKGSLGFGVYDTSTVTSLPIFALSNSNRVKFKNYYSDLTIYSAKEYLGLRPLAGIVITNSVINSKVESGSSLLSTLPQDDRILDYRPYIGVRYDFNNSIGLESKITQSKDFKTVGQIRASAKKEIFTNTYIDISGGFDKSSNYLASVGMVGLKINF